MPHDEDAIRLTAYFFWEADGYPAGREREYWERALAYHKRQEVYDGLLRRNRDRAALSDGELPGPRGQRRPGAVGGTRRDALEGEARMDADRRGGR